MSDEPEISMEQLQIDFKDLKSRAKEALGGSMPTAADIARFIKGDLLPFIENHVAQSAEMDGCIEDMMYRQEDVLQPETAAVFASIIVGGRGMALKVRELSPKHPDGTLVDGALDKAIAEYLGLCQSGEHIVAEITLPPQDDDDDEEDDDEDGDPDDEDDADDEGDEDDDTQGDAP